MVTAATKLKDAFSLEESYGKPRQCIKKQRHHFANKGLYSQSYGFSSCHVRMWELDHKESWVPKNWCIQTVVLEKTLESPLDCKEIKPVSPKGNQLWIFIGRTDAEAEAPILWPPDANSWLIGKGPDAGKDRRQEEKGMTWLDGITNQWTWVRANSRRCWRAGKLGVLQCMGSQRVGHDWVTSLHFSYWVLCPFQFSSVQSLSRVRLSVTSWTAAHQASLSITNSQSLLKLMSIESVMPSNHLILCLPLLPPVPPSIRVFSNESALRIRWPKYWSFSFSISPSNEELGLISFRIGWFDLHAVQGLQPYTTPNFSSPKICLLWPFHVKGIIR